MPPQTRSTNSKSPSPQKQASSTPTRKVPHCSQCGRPRAGHPRQRCSMRNSPTPTKDESISEGIGAMAIEDRTEEDEIILRARRASTPRKKVAFATEHSLESLSTKSSFILRNLMKSSQGGESSGEDTETEANINHVGDSTSSVPLSVGKTYPHSSMPCTLYTPQSSFSSTASTKDELVGEDLPLPAINPRRVARSQSWEEREAFLQSASETSVTSPASLYIFAEDDLAPYLARAQHLGLYAKMVSTDGSEGIPVVMGRDEKAVLRLYDIVKSAQEMNLQGRRHTGSGLKAAAGGAVVGAVATFTSLAFS